MSSRGFFSLLNYSSFIFTLHIQIQWVTFVSTNLLFSSSTEGWCGSWTEEVFLSCCCFIYWCIGLLVCHRSSLVTLNRFFTVSGSHRTTESYRRISFFISWTGPSWVWVLPEGWRSFSIRPLGVHRYIVSACRLKIDGLSGCWEHP